MLAQPKLQSHNLKLIELDVGTQFNNQVLKFHSSNWRNPYIIPENPERTNFSPLSVSTFHKRGKQNVLIKNTVLSIHLPSRTTCGHSFK